MRGEVSIAFLEQELNNPLLSLHAKEIIAIVVREVTCAISPVMMMQHHGQFRQLAQAHAQLAPVPVPSPISLPPPHPTSIPPNLIPLSVMPTGAIGGPSTSDHMNLNAKLSVSPANSINLPQPQLLNNQNNGHQNNHHKNKNNAATSNELNHIDQFSAMNINKISHPNHHHHHQQQQQQQLLDSDKVAHNFEQQQHKQQQQKHETQQHYDRAGTMTPIVGNQRFINCSPTPNSLAFTPTSVLRKMTAEKDINNMINVSSSQQIQTSEQNQQQPAAPRMILGSGSKLLQQQQPQQHQPQMPLQSQQILNNKFPTALVGNMVCMNEQMRNMGKLHNFLNEI